MIKQRIDIYKDARGTVRRVVCKTKRTAGDDTPDVLEGADLLRMAAAGDLVTKGHTTVVEHVLTVVKCRKF